jgi:hypothetical protein
VCSSDLEGPDLVDLVFASDRGGGRGGLDLYTLDADEHVRPLDALNSSADDAYWTWLGEHGGAQPAYFASKRGGHGFDIYEVRSLDGAPHPFGGAGTEIRRVEELSSDADDTAPFVTLDTSTEGRPATARMLFASNRAGGSGGFDLWTSRLVDGRWSAPENLGPAINSSSNEFRPSTQLGVLFFSSDRPGGKGGFDLYCMRWP